MKGTFAQKLSKAVSKFSGNLVVKTIASGMARLLPVIMIGSLFMILGNLVQKYEKKVYSASFSL